MSYIDIVVLRHLSARPTHGYELRKNVERTTGYTLHNNALYPALRRFEEAGAVEKRTEQQEGRPARIVYEITEVGRELLHDLIADLPPEQAADDVEFLTRIGQFDLIEPAERVEIVRRRVAALNQRIAHFAEVESRAHDDRWGVVVLHELSRRDRDELRVAQPTEGRFAVTTDARPRLGAITQFALIAGPLLSMLDSSIVNVAVVPIGRELGAGLDTVQWTVSGYLLALGVGLTATPYLSRRLGVIPLYRVALVAFTAASVACAFAPSIGALIGARIVQGLAGAPMVPLAMSMLLGGTGARKQVSPVAGILLFLGPAIGPSIGGLLIGAGGWRWVFLINLPIGCLAALAAWRLPLRLAPTPPDRGARFDLVGWLLLATGLTAVLLGASFGGTNGWAAPQTLIPIAIGVCSLGAYAWVAGRARHPVVDLRLVRTRSGWSSLLLCGLATVVTYATVFLLPAFAQQTQGVSALAAGLAMLPQGVLTGVSIGLGGALLRWWSIRTTVLVGFVVLTVASAAVLLVDASTPLWLTSLILACRAASLGLVVTPLLTAMLEPLPEAALPDANSLFSIWQRIVGSIGIGLLVSMFAQRTDAVGPVRALHESALVLVVVCAIGVLGALVLIPARAVETSRSTSPA